MTDVAQTAGVSVSTVSHVLNQTRVVNPDTARRVEEAMRSTGYRRNVLARALVTAKTGTIGLCMSAFTNPFFGELVRIVENSLSDAGYTLFIADSHEELDQEYSVVSSLLGRRVEGLIVAPTVGSLATTIPTIHASETPFVLLDRQVDFPCDQVVSEGRTSSFDLVTHLFERGFRQLAVLGGLPGLSTTHDRLQGVVDAYEQWGLPFETAMQLDGESSTEHAYETIYATFSKPEHPTAIVSLNNTMTLGAMRALHALGLNVPTDVVLVAYDDFVWSNDFEPRLTAMQQDVVTMGKTAVEMLLARIGGSTDPANTVQIPTRFQHRDSCGCHANLSQPG